jgi:16S rRNA (cytidine1402-2'-O)-methyltransferase
MLYIVSTPIGNLKDISQRALEVLNSVDLIIAESPKDSIKLLNAYQIKGKKLFKFNDKNAFLVKKKIEEILLKEDVAYITSAGTPAISDPGQEIVKIARNLKVKVCVVPGPSALVSAIAVSGIRAQQFTFISFPPKKSNQLKNLFIKFHQNREILVFFQSTYRIIKTISLLAEIFPQSYLFVAKEMTKVFENYFWGVASEVLNQLKSDPKNIKGEFVVIVDFSSNSQKDKK